MDPNIVQRFQEPDLNWNTELTNQRGEGWRLVEVLLTGGAPWGFTLRGGREHGEPLLITKIEEGSKAAVAGILQMGDEIIVINDVTLSGFRQEAICLVKGSHKTLRMVVKRRSEPAYRPHSWHSAKFAENHPEASTQQFSSTSDCTSWRTRCHASSSSHDLSSSWDHANFQNISEQYSSHGSMDSLDQQSHSCHHGRLSTAKSSSSSDHLENHSKRDSAYGSYSTNSSTPDHISSKAEATSAENMPSKLSCWDTGHYGNGRHSQYLIANSSFENKHSVLPDHYGAKHVEGSRTEEQPNTRFSFSGKSIYGPVWHVPEKKRLSCSSPPPQPPLRYDSLTSAKVHEKTDCSSFSEAFNTQNLVFNKSKHDQSSETTDCQQHSAHINNRSPDTRRYEHFVHRADVNPYYNYSGDHSNNNLLNPNRLQASLSSTDVLFAPSVSTPRHQPQHSDESTFFQNAQAPALQKQQNAVSNSKMHEMPSDSFQHPHSSHVLQSDSSSSFNNAAEQKTEYAGQNRSFYSIASKHPAQGSTLSQNKKECWISNMSAEVNVSSENDAVPSKFQKAKYGLPLQQESFSDKSSGKYHVEGADNKSATYEDTVQNSSHGEQENQKNSSDYNSDLKYVSSSFTQQTIAFPTEPNKLLKGSRLSEEESKKICPQSTPMLHSLSTASLTVTDFHTETESKNCSPFDSPMNRQSHKHDRFSTALRNEIQIKRAQLQKSKSVANLSGPNEAEEDTEKQNVDSAETFTSSLDTSFSNTYIDNLKEAQARVLRATSFKRRDLEPVLVEFPSKSPEHKANLSISSSSTDLSENRPLYEFNKAAKANPTNSGPHNFSRVGGRKRFSMEQKLKSYSEPEKMNKVGISEEDDLTGVPEKGLASLY